MVAELSREIETGQSLITDSTDMTMSEFVELAKGKKHYISLLSVRMKMQIVRILITELQQWTF